MANKVKARQTKTVKTTTRKNGYKKPTAKTTRKR